MKIMVAFLGKKKNKRDEYLDEIKRIHKNNVLNNKKIRNNNDYSSISKLKSKNITKNKKSISILQNKEDEHFLDVYKYTIGFALFLIFCIYKFPDIKLGLVNFATNFRQADEINVGISDVISTVSLFNKDNYVLADLEEKNSIESEQNEIVENVQVEESKEYQIIDEIANKYEVEKVLSKDVNTNITSETASVQKLTVDGIAILNYSSNRNIDFDNIMSKDINLTKKSDKILLYNTHTSESYTNSEGYEFEYSSTMRSLDARYNMLGIAKELNDNLLKKGFLSVQNTTPHDYGAYTGAYTKSRQTVTNALQSMGGAGIIIDVHRDAMEDLTYRPVASVDGVQVSQLMFVVGVGTGENKYWEENLRLALKLQQIANKIYPGLFRQMIIRDSTYNQDLNKYSLLTEFGATGNTIEEVKLSTRCLANLLNIIYKDWLWFFFDI